MHERKAGGYCGPGCGRWGVSPTMQTQEEHQRREAGDGLGKEGGVS